MICEKGQIVHLHWHKGSNIHLPCLVIECDVHGITTCLYYEESIVSKKYQHLDYYKYNQDDLDLLTDIFI